MTEPLIERIESLQIDNALLRQFVENEIIGQYEPVMQSPHFGGWSVTSSNGDYKDGWHMGHTAIKSIDGKSQVDPNVAKKIGLKAETEFRVPTEIHRGYLAEVMASIRALNLNPSRARISLVRARGHSSWHQDAPDGKYAVRLHIPIITNKLCLFRTKDEEVHLPADGSAFLLRVNRMHQVVNQSDQDRFHLIMQVWDVDGISRWHRMPPQAGNRT